MNHKKVEYIESLELFELRYELDKIYARLNQIEQLQGMIKELDNPKYNTPLNIMEKDYQLLQKELKVYQNYYNKLRQS